MILKNKSLLNYNTMGIDISAETFLCIRGKEEIIKYQKDISRKNLLVIGGGSNILFTKNFDGCVIKNEIYGIKVIYEDRKKVRLKVGAGVNWNEFVNYAVENNWSGIENMILIPGTVGASPVQNIGAYGQEVQNTILSVEAFDLKSLKEITLSNSSCKFSYRDSIFKKELKNRVIITAVIFELKKTFIPNLSFPSLANIISEKTIINPTIRQMADTVSEIRNKKLPDYHSLSNCGSFFKNPLIKKNRLKEFSEKNSSAPIYRFKEGYKLSAGWLIEQCGWKGKRIGNVGCYEQHSLVLVNFGGATGTEVLDFAKLIQKSVKDKFEITLDYEVSIF